MLDSSDQERLLQFYKESLENYGSQDARGVHWIDTHNQRIRFEVLLHVGPLSGMRVLDVGCGVGELYNYLLERGISCEYTGIDIVPDYIDIAKKRFPDASFYTKDIFDVTDTYEYVLSSGAMSFKVKDNDAYYKSMIQKMFDCAEKGLAFNMLDKKEHVDDETFASYSPQAIADFCSTFSDRVEIQTEYLTHDFTVFLIK